MATSSALSRRRLAAKSSQHLSPASNRRAARPARVASRCSGAPASPLIEIGNVHDTTRAETAGIGSRRSRGVSDLDELSIINRPPSRRQKRAVLPDATVSGDGIERSSVRYPGGYAPASPRSPVSCAPSRASRAVLDPQQHLPPSRTLPIYDPPPVTYAPPSYDPYSHSVRQPQISGLYGDPWSFPYQVHPMSFPRIRCNPRSQYSQPHTTALEFLSVADELRDVLLRGFDQYIPLSQLTDSALDRDFFRSNWVLTTSNSAESYWDLPDSKLTKEETREAIENLCRAFHSWLFVHPDSHPSGPWAQDFASQLYDQLLQIIKRPDWKSDTRSYQLYLFLSLKSFARMDNKVTLLDSINEELLNAARGMVRQKETLDSEAKAAALDKQIAQLQSSLVDLERRHQSIHSHFHSDVSRCWKCGSREHRAVHHPKHTPLSHLIELDDGLYFPSGDRACFGFNSSSGCSLSGSSHLFRHACSLCGSAAHGAQEH